MDNYEYIAHEKIMISGVVSEGISGIMIVALPLIIAAVIFTLARSTGKKGVIEGDGQIVCCIVCVVLCVAGFISTIVNKSREDILKIINPEYVVHKMHNSCRH